MRVAFTVYGQPASKANRRRFVLIKGKARSIKSPEALQFAQDMQKQIPPAARVMLTGECGIRLRMFYRDNRSDLDESVVLDCLQTRYGVVRQAGAVIKRVVVQKGVVLNDRQFKQRHVYHGIDPRAPRVEIKVWQLHPKGEQ